jgi:hypothetical protein
MWNLRLEGGRADETMMTQIDVSSSFEAVSRATVVMGTVKGWGSPGIQGILWGFSSLRNITIRLLFASRLTLDG